MVVCENENFITSNLLCFFTRVKLCPLVILLSLILKKNVRINIFIPSIVRSIHATSVVSLLVARDSSTSGRTPAYLWWAASRRPTYSWRCRANRDSARVNRWVQHCHLVSSSREQPLATSKAAFLHLVLPLLPHQTIDGGSFILPLYKPSTLSLIYLCLHFQHHIILRSSLCSYHTIEIVQGCLPNSRLQRPVPSTYSPTIPSSVHPWHSKPSSPVPQ